MPFDTIEFQDVAELLVRTHAELSDDGVKQDWTDCDAGRMRSAVNRVYYVALSELVRLVKSERPGISYPKGTVHSLVVWALGDTPGAEAVSGAFEDLRRWRERADYDADQPVSLSNVDDAFVKLDALRVGLGQWDKTIAANFAMSFDQEARRVKAKRGRG